MGGLSRRLGWFCGAQKRTCSTPWGCRLDFDLTGGFVSATNRAKKALETIVRFEAAWGASVRDEFVVARLRAGLTQKEVADRAGVTQATIAEFETTRWA